MNDLINIKVVQKDFNGEKKRFVNARELHQWLGVGKFFAKEYIIFVDMAKELAMLENTDIGKKVRKYFIRVEGDFKKVMRIAALDSKIIN